MAKIAETPLMTQYAEMKKKHPDAVLLFRVGDFYETFSDDAVTASEILGITLTRRANGKAASVPLAGFPHHALDAYLPKLVRAGKRVAICEQLEDPKLTKTLVKRGITELITPGVNTNEAALPTRSNNFLAGIEHDFKKGRVGVAFLDVTTGEFFCAAGDVDFCKKLIAKMAPKELLHIDSSEARSFCRTQLAFDGSLYPQADWIYTLESARNRLLQQFGTSSLKGFGVNDIPEGVVAAGSLLYYVDSTLQASAPNITSLSRIDPGQNVHLDPFTIRNLELVDPLTPGGATLLSVLGRCRTPMGSRLLRQWILFPLVNPDRISHRLDAVQAFVDNTGILDTAVSDMMNMGDLQRLASRAVGRHANPPVTLQLASALEQTMALRNTLAESGNPTLSAMAGAIRDVAGVARHIRTIIHKDARADFEKCQVINPGVNEELDRLRSMLANSHDFMQQILQREIETTGISSLKLSYNRVHGYYLEVRNTHRDRVPASWIRRQTLTSAERYITPELKEYEEQILTARDKIQQLEHAIFERLTSLLTEHINDIMTSAHAVGEVDAILSLASAARDYGYVRPTVDDSTLLEIKNGRHPVIERFLPPGEPYIPNSMALDPGKRQIMMITGPNMSGKSALLRQTALITLMAQIGSFVPAEAAHIGIVDKIFTRVGASDNISLGESTFMVEMTEAASILNNMSPRSLILFDELGRGTSTYDGISIARAIVEHIHNNPKANPKTLFATHYHELNEMERDFPRIVNYNVSVKEINNNIVFVRKLERGGSQHSFGIHVARMAGMPKSIVRRADDILRFMEAAALRARQQGDDDNSPRPAEMQMSLFQLDDPLLSQIRDRLLNLDIDNLTPMMALATLSDLQSLLTGK